MHYCHTILVQESIPIDRVKHHYCFIRTHLFELSSTDQLFTSHHNKVLLHCATLGVDVKSGGENIRHVFA